MYEVVPHLQLQEGSGFRACQECLASTASSAAVGACPFPDSWFSGDWPQFKHIKIRAFAMGCAAPEVPGIVDTSPGSGFWRRVALVNYWLQSMLITDSSIGVNHWVEGQNHVPVVFSPLWAPPWMQPLEAHPPPFKMSQVLSQDSRTILWWSPVTSCKAGNPQAALCLERPFNLAFVSLTRIVVFV